MHSSLQLSALVGVEGADNLSAGRDEIELRRMRHRDVARVLNQEPKRSLQCAQASWPVGDSRQPALGGAKTAAICPHGGRVITRQIEGNAQQLEAPGGDRVWELALHRSEHVAERRAGDGAAGIYDLDDGHPAAELPSVDLLTVLGAQPRLRQRR